MKKVCVLMAALLIAGIAAYGAVPQEARPALRAVRGVDMGPGPARLGPAAESSPRRDALASGAKVLLLGADDGAGPLQAGLLGYGDIASVDFYNFTSTLPTLGQLQAYNVVICWTDYQPSDPVAAGNLLADYVDGGGKLVLSVFAFSGADYWGLSGRVMTAAYTPLLNGEYDHYTWANLGTYNASSPIMQGITTIGDDFRDFTTLSPGATLVASWSDGENLVATKGCIVGINLYPGPYYDFSGDVVALYHNTVNYLMTSCGGLYDLSFKDDYGRSSVCVNSKTGDWQYSVLSGLGKGIYKGKGSVTKTAAQWSFRSAAGSPQLFLLTYYPPMSLASGSLGGGSFVSSLYDKNTKDDTFLCGP